MPRLKSRQLLPTAVKSRNLSDIIFRGAAGTGSTTLNNGEDIVFTSTLSQNDEYQIIALPYISLYVGSIASANLLPGGSGVDESQWQVIPTLYNWDSWDLNEYPLDKEYSSIYVRNISAGTQTVYIAVRHKYISPRESAT